MFIMTPILYEFSPYLSSYKKRAPYDNTNVCIGPLTKVTDCSVRQVLNNEYELKMSVLTTDPFAKYAMPGKVIMAKPNPIDNPQIFVIRNSNYNGEEIEIEAEHIKALFFNNIILAESDGTSFTKTGTPQEILDYILDPDNQELTYNNYFNFSSDISTQYTAELGLKDNRNLNEFFFNDEIGFNKQVKGEFKFNNFDISLIKSEVVQPKNSIRYGAGLSSYTQEMSDLKEYTHILPYADVPCLDSYQGDVKSVRLYISPNPSLCVLNIPNVNNDVYYRPYFVDFTDKFDKKGGYVNPSNGDGYVDARARILELGEKYVQQHPELAGLSANIKITYDDVLSTFDKPVLGDYVYVIYEPLNYKKIHRITEMTYNPIEERVTSLTVSDQVKRTFSLYDFIREVKYGHYV